MKPFKEQTYYELLELPRTATDDEIRAAHARLTAQFSDDAVAMYGLADPAEAKELRARILEAMEILTDADLRIEYERTIGLPPLPPPPADGEVPQPRQLAMTELLTNVEAMHSTYPQYQVSYIPRSSQPAEPAPEREPAAAASPPRPGEEAPLSSGPAEEAPPSREPEAASAPQRPADEPEIAAAPQSTSAEPVPARPPEAPPAEAADAAAPPVAVEPSAGGLSGGQPAANDEAQVPAPAAAPPLAFSVPAAERPAAAPSAHPSGRPASRALDIAPEIAPEAAIASAEAALAQVTAKVREARQAPAPGPAPEPRQKPVDIPADAEFNGELLRHVRQSRGMSLEQLAERTRITARHLGNVEADRYDALPVTVYLRGILMNIARELGLDPLRVSKSYLGLVSAGRKQ